MIVMIKELHEMTGLEFHQIAALRTEDYRRTKLSLSRSRCN